MDQNVEENEKSNKYVQVDVRVGDVIVIPAGVSHCSKTYSPDYRYLASYPKEGEHWRLIRKMHVEREEFYDNLKDVEASMKAVLPSADPVYGEVSEGLPDIWRAIR